MALPPIDTRSTEPVPVSDTHVTTARVIWAFIAASVLAYAVVAGAVIPPIGSGEVADYAIFYAVLGAFSAGVAIAVPILHRRRMPPRDRGTGPVPDTIPRAHLGRWFTTNLLSWALCESIAVYGLVLAFITHEPIAYYPFAGVALTLLIAYLPRRRDLHAVARAASKTL